MGLTRPQLAGLIGALFAIGSFRASVAIPAIGIFIEKNPYLVLGISIVGIVFSGTIAGWFVKS